MNEATRLIYNYVAVFWHRKYYFIATFFVILISTVVFIQITPANFTSTATILVEQQDIPEDWVGTSVRSFADERIELILKKVMTDENVLKVVDNLALSKNGDDKVAKKRLINRIRRNLKLTKVRADISDARDWRAQQTTIAFTIAFSDPDATMASTVANEIASLFLEENVKTRTRAASDTRRFLENELETVSTELVAIEKKIATFKEMHHGSLPEQQDLNVRMLQSAEEQILGIEQNIRSMEERSAFLQTSLEMSSRMASIFLRDQEETSLDPAQRLIELEARHQNLSAKYSKSHPDVVRVNREITEIRNQLGANGTGNLTSVPAVDPTIVRMKADLDAAAAEILSLKEQEVRLTEKARSIELRIEKAPQVESKYRILVRNRENLIRDHNEAQDKISEARLAETLESEQKGERFTLLGRPSVPRIPNDPNPKKLLGLGLILSFLGGFGAVVSAEKIDERVRAPEQVEDLTGTPVLSVVPYIRNQQDRKRVTRMILLSVVAITLVISAIFYVVEHHDENLKEIRNLPWVKSMLLYL